MSINSLYFRVGSFSFPWSASDVDNTQLSVKDEAQDAFLNLFKTALNDELTAAYQKATANTPLAGTNPVQDIWPGQPDRHLIVQRKSGLPLLCVYRTGTVEWSEHTLSIDKATQQWGLDLILGTLTVPDYQRLRGFLPRCAALIDLIIRKRGHASYQSGALQWGVGLGSLSSVRLVSHEIGQAKFSDDDESPVYHALSMTLETTELSYPVDGADADLDGATVTIGVGDKDQIVPEMVIARTEIPLE